MSEIIRIKPHHFIDILTSFGQGQRRFEPHPYGHAVHTVSERILADPDVLLEMDLGADDICRPCSHNIGGLCDDVIDNSYRPAAPPSKREWNLLVDRRWCVRLGLAQGDRLTAREFARLARDRAGDITDIYCEIPSARTAIRTTDLAKGIHFILETNKQESPAGEISTTPAIPQPAPPPSADEGPAPMPAAASRVRHFRQNDDWRSAVLKCPKCGWTGTFMAGDVEPYESGFVDSGCPKCFELLAVLSPYD